MKSKLTILTILLGGLFWPTNVETVIAASCVKSAASFGSCGTSYNHGPSGTPPCVTRSCQQDCGCTGAKTALYCTATAQNAYCTDRTGAVVTITPPYGPPYQVCDYTNASSTLSGPFACHSCGDFQGSCSP